MIKISIVVPVYNTQDFLAECLDSLISQTLPEIEIICIDDNSSDDSGKILQRYAEKDSRILVKENKMSGGIGPGCARNLGVGLATGEYVFFVDSDDWIDLNACEKLYEQAKENDLDILSFTGGSYLEKGVKREEDWTLFDSEEDYNRLMTGNEYLLTLQRTHMSPCLQLLRRSFLAEYGKMPEKIYFEDVPSVLNLYLEAKRIMSIQEEYYFYRFRENSITRSLTERHIVSTIFVSKTLFDLYEKFPEAQGYFFKHQIMIMVAKSIRFLLYFPKYKKSVLLLQSWVRKEIPYRDFISILPRGRVRELSHTRILKHYLYFYLPLSLALPLSRLYQLMKLSKRERPSS